MQDKKRRNLAKAGRPLSPDGVKSIIGKKLRAIQGDRKNAEICGNMGVAESTFRNYLSGESVPDARALASLAAETGVDLNWLLDDSREIPESGEAVYRLGAEPETQANIIDLPEVEALRKRIEELEADKETLKKLAALWEEKARAAEEAARTAGRKEANGA